MLSWAARPHVADLLSPRPPQAVSEAWCGDRPTVTASRGTVLLGALAYALGGTGIRLWLPDYFCNASTALMRAAGASLYFYPVREDFTPDWEWCESEATTACPQAMVLVNYFGQPNPALVRARTFCAERNILLVEDCAHALRRRGILGDTGDVVLFSPHKLLALPDGAFAAFRSPALAERVEASIRDMGGGAPPWGRWLAKRLLQGLIPESLACRLRSRRHCAFDQDAPGGPAPVHPLMSPMAERLAALSARRLDAEERLRGDGAAALADAMRGWPGCAPVNAPAQAQAAAPYRLVVRTESPALAASYFGRLSRAGLLVESWPDLAPEVTAAASAHAEAIRLRYSCLFLPARHGEAMAERVRRLTPNPPRS